MHSRPQCRGADGYGALWRDGRCLSPTPTRNAAGAGALNACRVYTQNHTPVRGARWCVRLRHSHDSASAFHAGVVGAALCCAMRECASARWQFALAILASFGRRGALGFPIFPSGVVSRAHSEFHCPLSQRNQSTLRPCCLRASGCGPRDVAPRNTGSPTVAWPCRV